MSKFLDFAPPGHFYSPMPDIEFVNRNSGKLFDRSITEIPGIALNTEGQLRLVEQFQQYQDAMPFREEHTPGLRFYSDNPMFGPGDAVLLYSMMRHFQPRRVIEVGSGFSSAAMLDTNDMFLSGEVATTFIEPYPERLLALLNDRDQQTHEIIADAVQNVPVERFRALEENDILFIDSSHVVKVGSDVVHLLTYVLPSLKSGVLVHFHDIVWPFEYSLEWLQEGRAWNEAYCLKAFLQFNGAFEIVLFNSYLAIHHLETVRDKLHPLFLKNGGCGLWLRRI